MDVIQPYSMSWYVTNVTGGILNDFASHVARLLRQVGRWARKPVNNTSWVDVVTPTDRPKSSAIAV